MSITKTNQTYTTHKHHIIPCHFGGSDFSWNIATLTVAEHADAHRRLYEAFGSTYDKWAWKFLTWQATQDQKALKEAQRINGKRAYQLSLGKLTREERQRNGKKGSKKGYALGLGKMTKEELSAASKKGASKGGKASAAMKSKEERLAIYQSGLGKRTKAEHSAASKKGGAMTKGMRWYNNGEINKKCLPGTQPKGFIRGRLTNPKFAEPPSQKGGEGNLYSTREQVEKAELPSQEKVEGNIVLLRSKERGRQ